MTRLTEKQSKWLQKAQNVAAGNMVYVAEFNYGLYAATIDGHRLHAIPIEGLAPGQYDLFENELQITNASSGYSAYKLWPQIVPMQYKVKQMVEPEKLADLKAKANEYNAICVNESLEIWLEYRYYYDATHYNGQCEMKILDDKHGVYVDYADGSLALVMPMGKKAMRPYNGGYTDDESN